MSKFWQIGKDAYSMAYINANMSINRHLTFLWNVEFWFKDCIYFQRSVYSSFLLSLVTVCTYEPKVLSWCQQFTWTPCA